MSYESVNKLLADLHAHRVQTMNPADLAVNINQRQYLVDTADRSKFVKLGDVLEDVSLADVEGGDITLDDLLARGPAVLVFFRFAGCPACNLTLPNYQRELWPGLQALGVPLVAISPQVPETLIEIKQRHQLGFQVASDQDNRLGHKFGIVFTANEESRAAALAKGTDMGAVTGTGTWDLPMPTAIVVGQDRVVRYAKISPDWLVRAEPDEILAAVRAIPAIAKAA
jgi:peroxiredoxin